MWTNGVKVPVVNKQTLRVRDLEGSEAECGVNGGRIVDFGFRDCKGEAAAGYGYSGMMSGEAHNGEDRHTSGYMPHTRRQQVHCLYANPISSRVSACTSHLPASCPGMPLQTCLR